MIRDGVCNTHSSTTIYKFTSLSGLDVIMWLQHLVLVPQLCIVIGHEVTPRAYI